MRKVKARRPGWPFIYLMVARDEEVATEYGALSTAATRIEKHQTAARHAGGARFYRNCPQMRSSKRSLQLSG